LPGDIKFKDIVGIDEYKEELEDIIKYFQNEKLY
jgi:ATP-dependent Zn protease